MVARGRDAQSEEKGKGCYMLASEAKTIEGLFGCIRGREEKCSYPIKMFGTILITDSYNLLFSNTEDELVFFRLRYIDTFYACIKGKRILIPPYKFKKYVLLRCEKQRSVVDVVHATIY